MVGQVVVSRVGNSQAMGNRRAADVKSEIYNKNWERRGREKMLYRKDAEEENDAEEKRVRRSACEKRSACGMKRRAC